jgi:hypothetical protein
MRRRSHRVLAAPPHRVLTRRPSRVSREFPVIVAGARVGANRALLRAVRPVANRWIAVTQRSGDAGADRAIAREILGYLENHPEAKDTLDGIAEWWLPHRRHERRAVERAVALLLSHGAIIETRRRGLPPYYQANRRAPPDIAARLGRPEE